MSGKTRLFVYGTLRSGHGNNRAYLSNSEFIGPAVTDKNYSMFGGGIPFVNKNHEKYPIIGEVYDVTPEQLRSIDGLEGHPAWYYREPIPVTLTENGEKTEASIYFNNNESNLMPTGDYEENLKKFNKW